MYDFSSKMTAPLPRTAQRLTFIDIFRGLAALWMIETHAVNEFLSAEYKRGGLFQLLNISNGFVAVAFIFCAGAGFWLALERKHDDYRKFGPAMRSYLLRLLFILGIAYILQTPKFSLARTLDSTPDDLLRLLQCNVLHLIVFSSLAALFAAVLAKKTEVLRVVYGALAVVMLLAAPTMRSFDPFAVMPVFPATLFAGLPVSLFPLFPWSCYFFAGAAATAFFRRAENKRRLAITLLWASAASVAVIFFVKDGLKIYSVQQHWWAYSPEHTLFRIAGAVFLFSGLFLLEPRLGGRTSRALTIAGQESLYIYVLQGVIIYSAVGKLKLTDIVGQHLSPPEVVLLILAIAGFCLATAALWRRFKTTRPVAARRSARIVVAVMLALFVVFPADF